MLDCLAYRTARNSVHAFRSEGDEIVVRREVVASPGECESLLQLGIDAYAWLERANRDIVTAIRQGQTQPAAELDRAIEALYRMWLPSAATLEQISQQIQHEDPPPNLSRFRECEQLVREKVAEFDKLRSLAKRVPSASDLSLIEIDPREWLSEPGWSQ
ncbi:MAG: hypothetical protein K1X71_11665 [Pirellulales bacterium]|nr:hypothetical protein [Pirellulales bacterium]